MKKAGKKRAAQADKQQHAASVAASPAPLSSSSSSVSSSKRLHTAPSSAAASSAALSESLDSLRFEDDWEDDWDDEEKELKERITRREMRKRASRQARSASTAATAAAGEQQQRLQEKQEEAEEQQEGDDEEGDDDDSDDGDDVGLDAAGDGDASLRQQNRTRAGGKVVWRPSSSAAAADGELEYDSSAYAMLHRLQVEWPCLSFDVVPDSLGAHRVRFPHSLYLVTGSQADSSHRNQLTLIKVKDMHKTKHDDDSSDDDDDDDDEQQRAAGATAGEDGQQDEDDSSGSDDGLDDEPLVSARSVRHVGSVNRVKVCPLAPQLVAAMSDAGTASIFDLGFHLSALDAPPATLHSPQGDAPLFTFRGHASEGYAVSWSPLLAGRLVSGDCAGGLYLWEGGEGGAGWTVDGRSFKGHSGSVEDLCWSPGEDSVFCFPESDTRVLTSWGLLFLEQIEALQRRGEEVLFGCYDEQSKALLYREGELVFPERPPPYLVDFTSAGEDVRWAEGSGDYGTEGLPEDNPRSSHVSLRVTPDHDMYVQLGNEKVSGMVAWSSTRGRRDPVTGKQPLPVPEPHRKVQAQDLLSPRDARACVRMLACAQAGYQPLDTSKCRTVQSDLHLDDTQFAAFIELLGFWLADGSLDYNPALDGSASGYVTFSQVKQADLTWLRSLLKKAGLKEDEHWLTGSSVRPQTTLYITKPAWVAFFDAEFGGKQARSQCSRPAAVTPPSTARSLQRPVSAAADVNAGQGDAVCYACHSTGGLPCLRGLHLREDVPDGNWDCPWYCDGCGPAEDGDAVALDEVDDEDDLPMKEEDVPVKPEPPVDDEPDAPDDDEKVPPPPADIAPGWSISWGPGVQAVKSVKQLPDWTLQELSKDEMRLLISGLHRADGPFADATNVIYTSSARFRDQLMQALLHCGYSAYAGLICRKGAIRGYNFHGQSSDTRLYSISFFAGLGAEQQRNYRPIMAATDEWKVSWAAVVDGHNNDAAAASCWPSMPRQQCVTRVPYDAGCDGRIWCVKVEHADHLIVAQRAQRGPDGSVTKQSRPIVVGNCSVSSDRTARMWDVRLRERSAAFVAAHKADVNVCSWNALRQHLLATGSDDGSFKVWDLRMFRSSSPAATFAFHERPITSIEWQPHEDSVLAAASDDDSLTVWDLSLETDDDELRRFSTGAALPDDDAQRLPPQLFFQHAGQTDIKELHWHRQIPGCCISTARHGLNIFIADNLRP